MFVELDLAKMFLYVRQYWVYSRQHDEPHALNCSEKVFLKHNSVSNQDELLSQLRIFATWYGVPVEVPMKTGFNIMID